MLKQRSVPSFFWFLLRAACALGCLSVCPAALLAAESTSSQAPTEGLRVATYNVQNYLSMNRHVDGRWRSNYPKPESEKSALRAVIHSVNPDILAIQEMGEALYLTELQEDLAQEGLVYPFAVWMESNDGVRHLAILSKVEPLAVSEHRDFDFAYLGERRNMRRGMLEAKFPGPGDRPPWHLFVFHLKSKWTEREDDPNADVFRAREAQAARDRISAALPPENGGRYLVAGDLNDYSGSGAVRRFLSRGDTPLGVLLPTTDSSGAVWTNFWARRELYSRKDYLIPSPALAREVAGGAAHISDHPASLEGSDHRLVYLDLLPGLSE